VIGSAARLQGLWAAPRRRLTAFGALVAAVVVAKIVLSQLDSHHVVAASTPWPVIVLGSMEATLTPLMQEIERVYAGVKVFSLPSVDHPDYGRHIELGVKGDPAAVAAAYTTLLAGLHGFNARLGPELVRKT